MSSLVHTPHRPTLRLLERPVRPVVSSPALAARQSLGQWCMRQVERFWAWGERSQHHRLGSWLRH
jgi:hypothetical protein